MPGWVRPTPIRVRRVALDHILDSRGKPSTIGSTRAEACIQINLADPGRTYFSVVKRDSFFFARRTPLNRSEDHQFGRVFLDRAPGRF